MKVQKRKMEKFKRDFENIKVYELDGKKYILLDEFIEVWGRLINVSSNRTNCH